MKIRKIIFSLAIAFFVFSCDNNESLLNQSQSSINQDLPVVKKIIEMGYKIEDIQESERFYLVQGDIMYSKNINDYKKNSITDRHASSNNLVLQQYRVITVGIDSSIPRSGKNDWRAAITSAMDKWSELSGNSISFSLSYDLDPDILIKSDDNLLTPLPGNVIAAAGFPLNSGKAYNEILINFDFNNNQTVSQSTKIYNMVHELGHCIGFRHTNWEGESNYDQNGNLIGANYIPNTPSQDANSVMNRGTALYSWNGFSSYDVIAVNYLYPPLPCNTRLSGPSIGTCAFDRYNDPINYNVYRIGRKQTIYENGTGTIWQITGSALEIVESLTDACKIRVKANNTEWPATGVVTMISSGGCSTTFNVSLNNCINYSYSD